MSRASGATGAANWARARSIGARAGLAMLVVSAFGSCGGGETESPPDEHVREVDQAIVACTPADCNDGNSCTVVRRGSPEGVALQRDPSRCRAGRFWYSGFGLRLCDGTNIA